MRNNRGDEQFLSQGNRGICNVRVFFKHARQYTAAKDFGKLMKLVGFIPHVLFFAPRYNIAPTQMAPVVFHDHGGPAMKLMRWVLIPVPAEVGRFPSTPKDKNHLRPSM
jgi:putative SOS response-associated peptidase YedK